jgi:HSP20 family protein
MAIIRWKPVDEVGRLRQEVDQLFGSFLVGTEPFFNRVYPAVNLSEKDNNLYIRAELPGVKPETLDISVWCKGWDKDKGSSKESKLK